MLAALTSLALALALVPGAAVTALAAEVEDAGAAVLKALTSDTVTASGTSGTVTWTLYDDGELVLEPTSGDAGTLGSFQVSIYSQKKWYSGAPWYSYRASIVSVTVVGTVYGASSVECMFFDCSSLTSLDLSGLDTSNVEDMSNMFYHCESLTSLDVSGFDTSNVEDMSNMFYYCESLTSLDVSGFDTSSVTSGMSEMFSFCSSLTSLDVSGFDTSSVTSMSSMFYGCSSLATVYVSELWSTESVTSDSYMFRYSTSLVGGNGTAYSSSHVDSE